MEGRGRATSGVTNLVLVGKTGNGKSATANSIVVSAAGNSIPQGNNKPFKSLSRSAPVTTTCQIERVTTKEVIKLSITGGDELEANEESLEDYLRDSSPILQEILRKCNGRKVLFDNKTTSETVKEKQKSELFHEAQEWSSKHKDVDSGRYSNEQVQIYIQNIQKAQEEQLKESQEMVEEHVRMATKVMEQRVAEQRSAREEIEKKSREKIRELEEQLRIQEDSASRNPKRLPFRESASPKLRQFCTFL